MSQKRVVIVSNQAQSLINFRGPFIKALVDRGLEVIALAPDYDGDSRVTVEALGAIAVSYSLKRSGINPLKEIGDLWGLYRLLHRLQADLVFCYMIKPVIYGTLAARWAGVPKRVAMIEGLGFSFTDDGMPPTLKRRMLRRIVSWLCRSALKGAHNVLFLNREDAYEFVQAGLVSKDKTFCLGGIGVELADWPMAPLPKEPVTFLLAARLLREKGILEYVEAARTVKLKYPQTRFILVGALDENPGALQYEEVQSWVDEGVLEWPGYVLMREWLARASVYVLPSYREGVPRSTQEAMAMGRPVITTDVPGCRETVIDGDNGFIVPVRAPGLLAESMMRFIEQPELIERMGARSRRIAEERFDVHEVNARLLQQMGL